MASGNSLFDASLDAFGVSLSGGLHGARVGVTF